MRFRETKSTRKRSKMLFGGSNGHPAPRVVPQLFVTAGRRFLTGRMISPTRFDAGRTLRRRSSVADVLKALRIQQLAQRDLRCHKLLDTFAEERGFQMVEIHDSINFGHHFGRR